MMDFLTEYGGLLFGGLGIFIAVAFPGWSSATGVGSVGKTAANLVKEEPEKFAQALILQLMPASQGLYGFVIGFMGWLQLSGGEPVGLATGLKVFVASLPLALVGYYSAAAQAEVANAGFGILAKRPEENSRGIIFSSMVEMYAILAFAISFLMLQI